MSVFKLWVDDIRQPPNPDWIWARSVAQAKTAVIYYEHQMHHDNIIIDLDHDAGDYVDQGGDYIKLLDWLEERRIVDTGYFFHLHTMNPVGRDNMRAIIEKNGWREIK